LAADEAALKSANDSTARTQALAAELDQAKTDLAATKAQLGDALKDAAAAKDQGAGASAAKASSDRQIADLSQRLAGAQTTAAQLQDENARLRRSSPVRPSAVVAAQAAQSAAAAPTPIPPVRQHVVVDGDTLTKISLEYYGTTRKWVTIYQANRDQLPNESTLSIGTVLRIP